ncbi:MAG: PQQ-binding-like beta-propeller repeat protein, partial [Planctomycetes bacterium]|nr:PQQ-binding-like beta-propeller repeat protein [Planctomycetota bacterium]
LAEYELEKPPVFDGLVAAGGRLYVSTIDGNVVCFDGE